MIGQSFVNVFTFKVVIIFIVILLHIIHLDLEINITS
jgi:hypothetical protein